MKHFTGIKGADEFYFSSDIIQMLVHKSNLSTDYSPEQNRIKLGTVFVHFEAIGCGVFSSSIIYPLYPSYDQDKTGSLFSRPV